MLKKLVLLIICVSLFSYENAYSATTATATVNYTIGSIDAIAVSGNPATLVVTTATAGSNPAPATDSTTSYSVTTNNTNRRITGSISPAMPTGVTLDVSLAPPAGATSAGFVTMTAVAKDLVTGITTLVGTGIITYRLTATATATQVTGATTTITYTISA